MPQRVVFKNGDEVVYKSILEDKITNIFEAETFFEGTRLIPGESISHIKEV